MDVRRQRSHQLVVATLPQDQPQRPVPISCLEQHYR